MKPTDPPSPEAAARLASAGHERGHHHNPEELHNDDVAHEASDIDIRALLVYAGGLAVVVAVVAVLMYAVFWLLERQAQQNDPTLTPLAAAAVQMPRTTTASPYFGVARTPQLLTNEPAFLRDVREKERQQLEGYGWVDQTAGVARMPIIEAKKLIVERGLPARADAPADPRAGTAAPVRGESSGGRTITTAPTEAAPGQPTALPKPTAQQGGH